MRVKPRILTIVQNLPVPFDRRVRLECQALVSVSYRFAVIQPYNPPGISWPVGAAFRSIEGLDGYQRLVGGPKAIERTAEV